MAMKAKVHAITKLRLFATRYDIATRVIAHARPLRMPLVPYVKNENAAKLNSTIIHTLFGANLWQAQSVNPKYPKSIIVKYCDTSIL